MTVAPLTGAWIETLDHFVVFNFIVVAPLTGAWIETYNYTRGHFALSVAPLTGAWIETHTQVCRQAVRSRTPHGCVD